MIKIILFDKDIMSNALLQIYINSCETYELVYAAENFSEIKEYNCFEMIDLPAGSLLEMASHVDADSFWYKNSDKDDLFDIINRTIKGESVYPESTPVVKIGKAYSCDFTKREIEVVQELVKGYPDVEIAEKLHVSLRTVKAHIQKVREKTGFRNRTEVAVQMSSIGLII